MENLPRLLSGTAAIISCFTTNEEDDEVSSSLDRMLSLLLNKLPHMDLRKRKAVHVAFGKVLTVVWQRRDGPLAPVIGRFVNTAFALSTAEQKNVAEGYGERERFAELWQRLLGEQIRRAKQNQQLQYFPLEKIGKASQQRELCLRRYHEAPHVQVKCGVEKSFVR